MSEISLWLAILAAFAATLVSASSIALKIFSRSRLSEICERQGHPERFEWLIHHRQSLVLLAGSLRACLHLGVLVAMMAYAQTRLAGWQPLGQYLFAFGVSGLMVSVFGVSIPSSWAQYHGEALLARGLPLMRLLLWVFRPLVAVMAIFDPIVRRLSGAEENGGHESEISNEVLSVVEAHDDSGAVHAEQKEMIEAIFEFTSTTVGEIMTPRTDVNGIEASATLEEVREIVLRDGHSRVPVYEENLDQILGILYVKDLIQYLNAAPVSDFDLRTLLRDALLIPESKPVRQLLDEFKAKKVHLAIVLDEYGGTAGLVTIEDILEELVGEIQDEYEPAEEEPTIRRLDGAAEGERYEVDARVHIDDLNDALSLTVPEDDDFDTVGGFVCSALGHIPEPGETFEQDGVRYEVAEAERTKVLKVIVQLLGAPDASAELAER